MLSNNRIYILYTITQTKMTTFWASKYNLENLKEEKFIQRSSQIIMKFN